MVDDIGGVKFIGVGFLAEDHGGFQRPRAAGGAVGDEGEIGKLLGVAAEIRRGRGLLPFQHLAILVWKEMLDFVHFRGSLGQRRKFGIGLLWIADKEEA